MFGAAASQAGQFSSAAHDRYAGVPVDRVGYAYGLTGVVGILLLMLAGGLTDLIGRKFVVVLALSLLGAGNVGSSFARSFLTILPCMLAAQIGLYMLLPPLVTLLSRISPARNQLRSQGLFTLFWTSASPDRRADQWLDLGPGRADRDVSVRGSPRRIGLGRCRPADP